MTTFEVKHNFLLIGHILNNLFQLKVKNLNKRFIKYIHRILKRKTIIQNDLYLISNYHKTIVNTILKQDINNMNMYPEILILHSFISCTQKKNLLKSCPT